jgi:hypothetical protein
MNILLPPSGLLNWSKRMIKWCGGRKYVSYIEHMREFWLIRAREGDDKGCSKPMGVENSAVKT